MGILDLFSKKSSASIAKNRLELMLAYERSVKLDYIEEMREEIIAVIKKYTKSDKVQIKTDSNQHINTLEIEITLDEKA